MRESLGIPTERVGPLTLSGRRVKIHLHGRPVEQVVWLWRPSRRWEFQLQAVERGADNLLCLAERVVHGSAITYCRPLT